MDQSLLFPAEYWIELQFDDVDITSTICPLKIHYGKIWLYNRHGLVILSMLSRGIEP